MKAVRVTGPRQCDLIEIPDPRIKDSYVKVKVLSAPLCTEYNYAYKSGNGKAGCIGHEAAGQVVEIAQPGRVKVGDRVVVMPLYACGTCDLCIAGDYIYCEHAVDPLAACNSETGAGTYAQYLIKPDWMLLPIPEDMSYDHAAMACCGLGPSFGAMQNMNVQSGETILITGLGPVGLGGVINGVHRGAKVIGVDSNPYRQRLAMELGAVAIIDPAHPDALQQVKDLTAGRGADRAMDCTAVPAAQKFAIQATRRRGHVTFVGWGGHIEMDNMVPDGLTLQGSWHYNLRDTPKILRLIRDSAHLIDKQITHRFPMSRIQDAWELQLTGQCGKVIVRPWE